MRNLLVFLGILGMGMNIKAQKLKPVAKVESVIIDFNGRKSRTRILNSGNDSSI
jgi:hypothetical protein